MFENLMRSLQRKLALWSVKKLSKRTAAAEIKLLDAWESINRVLICWPSGGMDILAARVVFNRIHERFPHAGLVVAALPGMGASPPSETDAEVVSIKWDDFSIFGKPSRRLRDNLAGGRYDATVDLSPRFDPFAASVCLCTEAPIRIGFAGPEGDIAYNFQVSPRSERMGIDRYRVLARYIG